MADPIGGNGGVGVKHRITKKRSTRPAVDLLGPDGRDLGAEPQLVLPRAHIPRNEPTLQLAHNEEGILVLIGDGAVQLVEGREITSTTIPWGAVQSFAMGLLGIIANYYPRAVEQAVRDALEDRAEAEIVAFESDEGEEE